MHKEKFLQLPNTEKPKFPISYNYIEFTKFEASTPHEDYPTSVNVNLYQTRKYIPSPYYKPISNITPFFIKNENSI